MTKWRRGVYEWILGFLENRFVRDKSPTCARRVCSTDVCHFPPPVSATGPFRFPPDRSGRARTTRPQVVAYHETATAKTKGGRSIFSFEKKKKCIQIESKSKTSHCYRRPPPPVGNPNPRVSVATHLLTIYTHVYV